MLRKFWRSEQGNYAAITAIAMVPIMTGVAGVVDFASTSNQAANLQGALDATALAIATRYFDGMTEAELQEFGYKIFEANLSLLDQQTTELDYDETASNFDASATGSGIAHIITVSSSIRHPGFVGGIEWRAHRTSKARVFAGQDACVLALNPHASRAIEIQGSTTVSMEGCVIASNSNATDSVYRGGSAKVKAECAIAVGGIVGLSDSNSQFYCPSPLPDQYPSFDPLSGMEPPPYGSCTPVKGGKSIELTPGTYCDKAISGAVTLEPGVYLFKGTKISLGGNGSLIGTGVTIFLLEGAQISVNANQVIELSPSSTGPYAGITIYQARGNTSDLTLNGGAGSSVNGFIYAPNARVTYTGNSDTRSDGCIRIIGDTVAMTGNSSVKADCEVELGGRQMYAGRSVVLVE
ncbi:pilus assembly protein [Pseudaminobacter arsenicus]|uniref:Pilus assembly protein n=1 Tax=Borborobacter arsenicus TaxID=1851146 RepID=A0A432UZW7_9HYPH|nr:TadE/TadG family type IV pilus assembly protein [Pseudaminobacter arsenicus]RUM95342.1 pilus assembly protein [Pseudaminobacter arsenicus]